MEAHPTPIDISTMPDLVQIVEEVAATKKPRELKRDNKIVAVLMPVETAYDHHHAIELFDFQPVDKVRASFLEAGYSEAEVNDMLDALSELPQYGKKGRTLSKSQ